MKSSNNRDNIDHIGIVQSSDENSVMVSISSESACSGCEAEGACGLAGKENKIIEIYGHYNVKPGDIVTVLMKRSMGYTALLFGYLLPLLAVITILIIMVYLKVPEIIAGITSLSVLLPYYFTLFFFRNRINEKFTFSLKY